MDISESDELTTPVEYRPVNVKDVLIEMKDTAELLIDLSYSAVLHQSDKIAAEVLRLEHRMDVLELRAQMGLLMAARSPSDAEQLAPVLGIVAAADQISDAAGDIAKIVLEDIGLPEAMRAALPDAVESLLRGEVAVDSEYAGRTLGKIDLESRTGIRVIALRRGDDWLLNPGPKTSVESGDIALLRGPESEIGPVYETLTGHKYDREPLDMEVTAELERAVDAIIQMKNLSELAVDLAYSSVLFDDEELAEEVSNIEIEVDNLESRFEAWVLQAAAGAEDPVRLRGLIHLGTSTETISDAALDISEGVLRDIDVHPVVQMAVHESDEILSRAEITDGSALDGTTVTGGVSDTDAAISVVAVRRPGDGWLLVADSDAEFRGGDIVIAKGTRTTAAEFRKLARS